jgi:hypothetical protein
MEAASELETVQAQLQQLRAELGLGGSSSSSPGSDAAPRQPESEADTHNADTFGEAAQNESIDDATNDEVRGMQLPGSAPLCAAAATALPAAQLGE